MSGEKRRKKHKSNIFQDYIKYILSFLIIALAVFIAAILIAMKPVTQQVNKIENSLNMQVRDVVINDSHYPSDDSASADTYGDKIGNVTIENCGLNCDIYYGSNRVSMRYGAGFLNDKNDFASGKMSVIKGYDETYFSSLKYAQKGDIVTVTTNNGEYRYRVTDTKYIDENTQAYQSEDIDMLVLYSIFSDFSDHAGERFYVFADKIIGEVE
ncbi:MAG: sortase [Eubacterium sp.]|nr:sortase [Eubacterium sp.]